MHKADFNKFKQNNELKQELLATSGTTLAQACLSKVTGVQVTSLINQTAIKNKNGTERKN